MHSMVTTLGRNAPCHCGSGKKYKRCCLDLEEMADRHARAAVAAAFAADEAAPSVGDLAARVTPTFTPIDIDAMTEAELVELHHRIVDRIRFLRRVATDSSMREFRIGERVRFHPDGRPSVVGMITRHNQKTVTVVTDEGQRWNVAPQLLERAAQRLDSAQERVIAIQGKR